MKKIDGLSKEQAELYDEIYTLFNQLKTIETDIEDYSKYYIIFAHNLNTLLDMPEKAEEMLKNIDIKYLENGLVKDMLFSVECRNKAAQLYRRRKNSEADSLMAEAEYFLCALGILKFMTNISWISTTPQFAALSKQLSEVVFDIENPPKLELIKDGYNDDILQ